MYSLRHSLAFASDMQLRVSLLSFRALITPFDTVAVEITWANFAELPRFQRARSAKATAGA
jgi:hypothetical protein